MQIFSQDILELGLSAMLKPQYHIEGFCVTAICNMRILDGTNIKTIPFGRLLYGHKKIKEVVSH